jgi:F-type H+-transporting ATPase subunit a
MNLHTFASADLHISLAAEELFSLGGFSVTNALLLGVLGIGVMLLVLFYVTNKVKKGQTNYLVGTVQWMFEILLNTCEDIMGSKTLGRRIAPLAITIFFTVLFTYWISVLPGVGSITLGGVPLFRGLPADLNFTFALAIITILTGQIYAIRHHGFFGNIGRFAVNPFKDPIGSFVGLLEFIGEFSRMVALSFRLFGNAFAGEVLLLVIAVLTSYFGAIFLPPFIAFELFIGFIQAYVFFVLTLIFTSLALVSHGDHSDDHSSKKPHLEGAAPL